MPKKRETYFDILTAAINDLAENGYDSAERIVFWLERLRAGAVLMVAAFGFTCWAAWAVTEGFVE